jgi:outer membrane protein assembly factor BamD
MKNNLLYSVILGLMLVSCSGFEKILKSSDYNLKYRKAFEYYKIGDYGKSSTLFDDIVNVFRGTTKADTLAYYQAMSYYKQKDYILGGHYFNTFAQNFMYSPFTEEAEFLEADCYYQLSPRAALDQASTTQAIESLKTFLNKYPYSKHGEEARIMISELEDKLVEKSRLNAKLYYDMGLYKSSIIALKNSLDDYPDTKHKEELMWLVLDSNFRLAENSVPSKQKERYQTTLDEYYSFTSHYPNSRYKDDADQIYKATENFLK